VRPNGRRKMQALIGCPMSRSYPAHSRVQELAKVKFALHLREDCAGAHTVPSYDVINCVDFQAYSIVYICSGI
jgi:hypothetical protein